MLVIEKETRKNTGLICTKASVCLCHFSVFFFLIKAIVFLSCYPIILFMKLALFKVLTDLFILNQDANSLRELVFDP